LRSSRAFVPGLRRKADRLVEALAPRQLLAAHGNKLAGGIEQGLSSLTSMIGLSLLSRMMDINAFGIVATASGIWLMMEMIQHSVTINPFILSCPHPETDREGFGAWVIWNFLLALATAGLFMIGGMLLHPHLPAFAEGLFLSGPLCLAAMIYMFLRRLQYHQANRLTLLCQTMLYSAVYLVALIILSYRSEHPTPVEGAAVLTVAYAIPAIVMSFTTLRGARFNWSFTAHVWKARKLVTELGAAGIIWQVPYTITLLALSIFSSPAAVAIFTVTRTLVRPITLVMATIGDVEYSRASRTFAANGIVGLAGIVRHVRNSLWLLNALPIALLLCFPGFFLSLIYGQQYADATLDLQLRVLMFVPLIYLTPMDMSLAIVRDTRYVLIIYTLSLVACLVYLVGAYCLGVLDATAALASLVFARLVPIPFFQRRYWQKILEPCRTAPGLAGEARHA